MAGAVWDDRDLELGLRDKLAQVVAEIVSGVPNANPDPADYDYADILRGVLEEEITRD